MEYLTNFVNYLELIVIFAISQIVAFLLLMIFFKLCGVKVSITTNLGDDI